MGHQLPAGFDVQPRVQVLQIPPTVCSDSVRSLAICLRENASLLKTRSKTCLSRGDNALTIAAVVESFPPPCRSESSVTSVWSMNRSRLAKEAFAPPGGCRRKRLCNLRPARDKMSPDSPPNRIAHEPESPSCPPSRSRFRATSARDDTVNGFVSSRRTAPWVICCDNVISGKVNQWRKQCTMLVTLTYPPS